jgi:hypothetical protein
MSKIINFPDGDEDDNSGDITVNKEYCSTCGGGLELWTSTDLVAYGVCPRCDLGLGTQPIILVKGTEH